MNLSQRITQLTVKYSQDNPHARYNPWVIGWFSLVAVFLAVNAVFIVFAVISSPGLVVENYYEQGRQYEKNALKLLTEHKRLQWETKLEVPEIITLNSANTYRFSAVDSRGVPIRDAEVKLTAYRPSSANADFTTALQQIAPGLYQANVSFPLPGIWDLNVKVVHGEDHFEVAQRLSVQPQT